MSSAPRRRQAGSWLARIFGSSAERSYVESGEQSDSESHNSHRSTAAELPPPADTQVLADSFSQTDPDPVCLFSSRLSHARKFLRDVVEVVDEPFIPKRIKIREFSHVYQTQKIKPRIPIVSAFDPKIAPIPSIAPIPATTPHTLPTITHNPSGIPPKPAMFTPILPPTPTPPPDSTSKSPIGEALKAPAPSPQSSATTIPTVREQAGTTGAGDKEKTQAVNPSSFFVKATTPADAFIEDSGFLGGEDDDSEGGDDEQESVPPPANNPFFASASGSLFTGGSDPFTKPAETKPTPTMTLGTSSPAGGSPLFGGGGNVMGSFASGQGFGSPNMFSSKPLQPISPFGSSDSKPGPSLFPGSPFSPKLLDPSKLTKPPESVQGGASATEDYSKQGLISENGAFQPQTPLFAFSRTQVGGFGSVFQSTPEKSGFSLIGNSDTQKPEKPGV